MGTGSVMTNESEQSEGGQSELEHVQSQVNEAIAKLTGPGEPLIALGAALLVFVDVFGAIIFEEYSLRYMGWLPAVLIIVAIVAHRFGGVRLPVDYGMLLASLAFVAGVMVARDLIWDLRNNIFDGGGGTVVFALIAWAGGAVSLVGAWQVWGSMSNDS